MFISPVPVAARLLRSWVWIPPGVWIFDCCECCVLSGRGLCDELITRPEESYRLWCVVVCDLETSRKRRPWPALGRSATTKKKFISILYMFRAPMCSSSGESIVSIRHLLYVTLCRWPSGMQVWIELHGVPYKPAYQTVTYIEWHIPDVLIQLILLMMSTWMLETCRELK